MAVNELLQLAWLNCWQVSLLIGFVYLFNRFCCSQRPQLAYALWIVVLLKCVTPPVFSSPSGAFCLMQPERPATFTADPMLDTGLEFRETPSVFKHQIAESFTKSTQRPTQVVEKKYDPKVATIQAPTVQPQFSIPSWQWILIAAWGGGALLCLVAQTLRFVLCMRKIDQSSIAPDNSHEQMLTSAARDIGISRKVRIAISSANIGPSVIGVINPTIVLPQILTSKLSTQELKLILAHELVHIRRGDLQVGVLQTIVQACWWINPLIRFANRWLNREIERCCDEEVIGSLGIAPATYARTLIRVLEQRSFVRPVAACPGVRPIEITSNRLERIMNLGHGSQQLRRKVPAAYVFFALAAAFLVLPGAAQTGTREAQSTQKSDGSPLVTAPKLPLQHIAPPAITNKQDELSATHLIKVYPVYELLDQYSAKYKMDRATALKNIEQTLMQMVRPWSPERKPVYHGLTHGAQLHDGSSATPKDLANEILSAPHQESESIFVTGNREAHEAVKSAIQSLTANKAQSFAIRTSIISCDEFTLEEIDPNWQPGRPLIANVNAAKRAQLQKIFRTSQARNDATLICAPKLVTGLQTCEFSSVSERPFVTFTKSGQPIAEIVPEGLLCRFRVLNKKGNLFLQYFVEQSKVTGVNTVNVTINKQELTKQVPIVDREARKGTSPIDLGQGFLVGGMPDVTKKNLNKRLVYFFEVEKAEHFKEGQSDHRKNSREPLLLSQLPETETKATALEWKPEPEFLTREFDVSWFANLNDETYPLLRKQTDGGELILNMSQLERLTYIKELVTDCVMDQKTWRTQNGGKGTIAERGPDKLVVKQTEKGLREIEENLLKMQFQFSVSSKVTLSAFEVSSNSLDRIFRNQKPSTSVYSKFSKEFEIDGKDLDYVSKTLAGASGNRMRARHESSILEIGEVKLPLATLLNASPDYPNQSVGISASWNGPSDDSESTTVLITTTADFASTDKSQREIIFGTTVGAGKAKLVDVTDWVKSPANKRMVLLVQADTKYDQELLGQVRESLRESYRGEPLPRSVYLDGGQTPAAQ